MKRIVAAPRDTVVLCVQHNALQYHRIAAYGKGEDGQWVPMVFDHETQGLIEWDAAHDEGAVDIMTRREAEALGAFPWVDSTTRYLVEQACEGRPVWREPDPPTRPFDPERDDV